MTDDIGDRLDDFEETLERQQETIERQEATIERQRERIDELEAAESSDGSVGVSRRRVMQAGGALGLLGLGVGTASADPSGQVGTSEDLLNALYTESLQGGIVPEGEIENLVGEGLGIYPPTNTLEVDWGDAGDLDEGGNVEWETAEDLDDDGAVTDDGDWTETDDGGLLEPTNTSVNGVSLGDSSNSDGGKTTIGTDDAGSFLHFNLGVYGGGGLHLNDFGSPVTHVRIIDGLPEATTDSTIGPVHITDTGALVVGTEPQAE